jgi:hypothetical protein
MERPPRKVWMPIAEAASDALETPMEELPPLSTAIDLDGLDAVITNSQSNDVTVTFSYAGLRVLVHSSNTVYVRPLRSAERDPL